MQNIAKNVVYFLIALTLVFVSAFVVQRLLALEEEKEETPVLTIEGKNEVTVQRKGELSFSTVPVRTFLNAGDIVKTNNSSGVILSLPRHGVLRFRENAIFKLVSVRAFDHYVVELQSGEAYGNMLFSDSRLTVYSGDVTLSNKGDVFNVKADEEKVIVLALKRHTDVGLLMPNMVVLETGVTDDQLYQRFLVTEGDRVSIARSKITPKIAKLLYSKLIKEFQYGSIAKSTFEDMWFKENERRDAQFFERVQVNSLDAIRARGLTYASLESFSYTIKTSLFALGQAVTFDDEKRVKNAIEFLSALFNDAMYLTVIGNTKEASKRLEAFKSQVQTASDGGDELFQAYFREWLDDRLSYLQFVLPDQGLFSLRDELRDLRFAFKSDTLEDVKVRFMYVRSILNDAYAILLSDADRARLLTLAYFKRLEQFLNQENRFQNKLQREIVEENNILANLFLKHPVFYTDDLFEKKSALESIWLSLIAEGIEKDEERQTLIMKKIDLLNRLQEFFFQEKISIVEARNISFRIIREINDLIPVSAKEVAVTEIFEKRLATFGQFWTYLNSEFASSPLYGATHNERFTAFEKAQKEEIDIEKVRAEIVGAAVPKKPEEKTIDQIVKEVTADFTSIGVKDLKVGAITDPSKRVVSIESGVLKGVKFNAQYDRIHKLVSKVFVGGESVFESSVKLEHLEPLLRAKLTPPAVAPVQPGVIPPKVETKAEKLARLLVVQILVEVGFDLKDEQITIINLSKKLFHVDKMKVPGHEEIVFSFDFQSDTKAVTNVMVQTSSGPQKLGKEVTLQALNDEVQKFYENALLQKLEEETGVSGLVEK